MKGRLNLIPSCRNFIRRALRRKMYLWEKRHILQSAFGRKERKKDNKTILVIVSSENIRKNGVNKNLSFNKTVKTAVFTQVQTKQWPSLHYTGLERQ
jgi:hypothetical protein